MFFPVLPFYAFMFVLFQLLFTAVCLPGCILLPLPYIFGTVQNGAHFVWVAFLFSLFFLLGCFMWAIFIIPFVLQRPLLQAWFPFALSVRVLLPPCSLFVWLFLLLFCLYAALFAHALRTPPFHP